MGSNRGPLPKAPFAAGVTILGGMFYAVLLDAKGRQQLLADMQVEAVGDSSGDTLSAEADTRAPLPSVPFLGGYGQVSAANVPPYVLASTNLDAEQKLQVALARRQCWVRAFQLGPALALCSYSACVLIEATGLIKLPRGSRTGVRTVVPLGFCAFGMMLGALAELAANVL